MSRSLSPARLSDPSSADPSQLDEVTDTGRPMRVGLWALAIGFGGFLLWASIAPLDEGVPTDGMVVLDTKRKAVQHLSGGIVREVLVKEGDLVQEGQALVVLDEATVRANYEAVRQRYLNLRAMQARLLAERQRSQQPVFHPDLLEAAQDPLIQTQMAVQTQLAQTRLSALRADIQALEENILGQQAMMASYQTMQTQRRMQLGLLEEQLTQTRGLVAEGYAPRNQQLDLERSVAETRSALAELAGNMERSLRAIAETRQRILARQQGFQQEVEGQLTSVQQEVEAEGERYRAVRAELGRTEIRAPATGQVVGLAVQTVGGVTQPGQKLMDIVPADEPLLLETRVAPHLIDRVHAGLKTDVRFSAFSHSPELVVQGQVVSVSKDLLADPNGAPYYLARVMITPQGIQALGPRRIIQPGMPAQVIVKTGERSLLTYLLAPLTRRLAASLKEE